MVSASPWHPRRDAPRPAGGAVCQRRRGKSGPPDPNPATIRDRHRRLGVRALARRASIRPACAPASCLPHASRQLTSIEVNATYYRTQNAETFRAWHDATPDGFAFAVKGPRAATQPRDAARAAACRRALPRLRADRARRQARADRLAVPADPPVRAGEFAAFLDLLPPERDGRRCATPSRPQHESFRSPECAGPAARPRRRPRAARPRR